MIIFNIADSETINEKQYLQITYIQPDVDKEIHYPQPLLFLIQIWHFLLRAECQAMYRNPTILNRELEISETLKIHLPLNVIIFYRIYLFCTHLVITKLLKPMKFYWLTVQ